MEGPGKGQIVDSEGLIERKWPESFSLFCCYMTFPSACGPLASEHMEVVSGSYH